MRAVAFLLRGTLLMGGIALVLSSCGTREILYNYVGPGSDAGADASQCTCVDWRVEWQDPIWLRTFPDDAALGSGDGVPTCADYGRDEAYQGHAGLVAPPACGPCECQPPTGSCELPSKLTASTAICGGGVPSIPFDAPPSWNGACDNSNPIGAGAGVKSLTVPPVIVKDSCEVGPKIPERAVYPVAPYWHTFALGCHGKNWRECGDRGYSTCVPDDDAPSPDFKLCILQLKAVEDPCPEGWPDKKIFYGNKIDDHRHCTDCACGPSVGSMCSVPISIYDSNMCNSVPILTLTAQSNMPMCGDIPPGVALDSKRTVAVPTYLPGKCAPMGGDCIIDMDGGTAATADPTSPTTFCCKP